MVNIFATSLTVSVVICGDATNKGNIRIRVNDNFSVKNSANGGRSYNCFYKDGVTTSDKKNLSIDSETTFVKLSKSSLSVSSINGIKHSVCR